MPLTVTTTTTTTTTIDLGATAPDGPDRVTWTGRRPLVVTGRAGSGKTVLARRVASQAHDAGVDVVSVVSTPSAPGYSDLGDVIQVDEAMRILDAAEAVDKAVAAGGLVLVDNAGAVLRSEYAGKRLPARERIAASGRNEARAELATSLSHALRSAQGAVLLVAQMVRDEALRPLGLGGLGADRVLLGAGAGQVLRDGFFSASEEAGRIMRGVVQPCGAGVFESCDSSAPVPLYVPFPD